MLKVSEQHIEQKLDTYMGMALTQSIIIERPQQGSVVMLSLAEFERLQALDEAWLAASLRLANREGYLDHDQQVRQRLATAMNQRRTGGDGEPHAPSRH